MIATDPSLTRSKLKELNLQFEHLPFHERLKELYNHFDESEVLVTSSFGTSAVFLLHLISRFHPTQKIHFIDTNYHFPETLAYKEQLTRRFGLSVVPVLPHAGSAAFTQEEKTWETDPNLCCTVNKVLPLAEVKSAHQVWISGLMSYQNPFRQSLKIFEQQNEIIKFHPLIDTTEEEVKRYLSYYNLPEHPLLKEGYGSVGCTHCTEKGEGRMGRWKGNNKSECGLHAPMGRFRSAQRTSKLLS